MSVFQEAFYVKIRRILSITAALAAILSAFGCSGTNNSEVSEEVVINTGIDPHSIIFDWQKSYEEKLKEFSSSSAYSSKNSRFDLYDIDLDGTPELIISPDIELSSVCEIYTYRNALEKVADIGANGAFRYIPSLGCIGYEYSGDGFVYGEYHSASENPSEPSVTYYNNLGSAAAGATISYEINNTEVTLAEYESAVQIYSGAAAVDLGRKYSFGEKSIDYALHCSQSWGAVLSDIQKNAYKKILSDIIANSPENDAAFEIADLDGNNVPELILSTGFTDICDCHVYFLNEAVVNDLGTSCGQYGCFTFDVENSVFFSDGKAETQCWSLNDADLDKFKPSENTMVCGRSYILTNDSVNFAFR